MLYNVHLPDGVSRFSPRRLISRSQDLQPPHDTAPREVVARVAIVAIAIAAIAGVSLGGLEPAFSANSATRVKASSTAHCQQLKADRHIGQAAACFAQLQIGKTYVWGGESRKEGGFDCSGLMWWAYNQAGVKFTRTTANILSQKFEKPSLHNGNLKAGDLVFSNRRSNGAVGHVFMYIGGGKIVEASSVVDKVRVTNLSSKKGILGYGRVTSKE